MQLLAWCNFCSWPQWTFQIWRVICDLLATSYYLDEPSRSVIQMELCTQMDRNVKQHSLGCGPCRPALWYLAAVRSRAPDGHVLFWLSRSTIGLIYLHNSVFSTAPLSTQTPPCYAVRPLGRGGSEIMYFSIKLSVRAAGSHLASGVTDMEAASKCGSMSCQTSRAGGWRHL